jgi:hypothetical protein
MPAAWLGFLKGAPSMKYRVAESVETFDDAPSYEASSAEAAALEDAAGIDGLSDGFTSYVIDEHGEITEVSIEWVPGHWEAR